jgi:hypothetical protein
MEKITKNQLLINNYQNLHLQKLLPEIFKNGFIYRLVNRTESKFIYAQYSALTENIIAYEVFKNKIIKFRDRMIELEIRSGKNYGAEKLPEFKEAFPNDEDFGRRAWTYQDLETAQKRYATL